jgi:hypothetical protein
MLGKDGGMLMVALGDDALQRSPESGWTTSAEQQSRVICRTRGNSRSTGSNCPASKKGIGPCIDKDHHVGLFCNPPPARPRRIFTGFMIAVTSGVVVLAAGCAGSTAPSTSPTRSAQTPSSDVTTPEARVATTQPTSSSGDAIHFPATLVGLPQNTSPAYDQAVHAFTQELASLGEFTHPEATLYGSSTGPLILVGGAEWSARAKKYGVAKISPAAARRGLLIQGSPDARMFPAGMPGALLACGHVKRAGLTEIDCAHYDKKAVGVVVYLKGSASSLSDAASKTKQVISAIGG